MIKVQGLSHVFGPPRRRVPALVDVSWQAEDGRITGLLGPNGAGKTTTLRVLAGLMRPDAGQAWVGGIDVLAQPQQAQARLGVLSDGQGLYPRLTAAENIHYHARLQGMDRHHTQARVAELAGLLEMRPLLDRRAEGFSQGERMKTALARALVHRPSHLILDEPTNGLDVMAIRALRQILRRLRDEERQCVLLSTHVMGEVERLCDEVVLMAHGRVAAQGTVAGLCQRTGQADFEAAFVQLAFATPPEDTA